MPALPAYGAVYEVDRTDDTVVNTCSGAVNDCTLRGAITAANATGLGDTITFGAAVSNQTFTISTILPAMTGAATHWTGQGAM